MSCGGSVGGCAAKRLLEIKGEVLKDEMLTSLHKQRSDFNYCSNLGSALQPFMREEDLARIAALVDLIEPEMTDNEEHGETFGFIIGASVSLHRITLSVINAALLPQASGERLPKARGRLMLHCIRDRHSTEALEVAAGILMKGFKEAAATIYFLAKYHREDYQPSFVTFDRRHVSRLIELFEDKEHEPWALPALRCLCGERKDLADMVNEQALKEWGLKRAALFNAIGVDHNAFVFSALNDFAAMNSDERKKQPEFLLSQMELNWIGQEELFLKLLRLRNAHLAWCLLESVSMSLGSTIGTLDIGDIQWWLEWLSDAEDPKTHWWFQNRLSILFSRCLEPATQNAFLAEFNRKDSKYRDVLARTILGQRRDLTTDHFSEDALSFLVGELCAKGKCEGHDANLLGSTATEMFVSERLVPLLPDAKEPLLSNLKSVLEQAGSRHGRRYIST